MIVALTLILSCDAIAEEQAAELDTPEILSPVQKRMQQEVSVDFAETPIDDVLRILAKQADVDIVKSPKVIGMVTATLTDVPLAEALDNILSAHGYGYVATENMIRVVPQDEIYEVREKIDDRVYRIKYADVKEVEKALMKFISTSGSISANPGTSNIIVTDVESKVKAIDKFIEEIDRITPQILVEAKIYDVKTTDTLDIGVDWQIGRNSTIGTNVGDNPTPPRTDPFINSIFGSANTNTTGNGLLRFGLFNESFDFDAQLKLLQEDSNAKLLASPSILGLDNEIATFKIITEIPFQELTQTGEGAAIGTVSFREVGVELSVVPHVTESPSDEKDGMIRLQIQPKFSVEAGNVAVGTSDAAYAQPKVDTREASITTLVQNGQTLVIAGLRKKDVTQDVSKIPLLGDIPILGAIFKSETEKTINSQLFVFITATIIEDSDLPMTEKQNLAIEELDMNDIPPQKPLRVDRTEKEMEL